MKYFRLQWYQLEVVWADIWVVLEQGEKRIQINHYNSLAGHYTHFIAVYQKLGGLHSKWV